MDNYKDLDTLYDFLKGITSIEEFFARKEPAFNDEVSRLYAETQVELGSEPESVLSALKSHERQTYAADLKQHRAPN